MAPLARGISRKQVLQPHSDGLQPNSDGQVLFGPNMSKHFSYLIHNSPHVHVCVHVRRCVQIPIACYSPHSVRRFSSKIPFHHLHLHRLLVHRSKRRDQDRATSRRRRIMEIGASISPTRQLEESSTPNELLKEQRASLLGTRSYA